MTIWPADRPAAIARGGVWHARGQGLPAAGHGFRYPASFVCLALTQPMPGSRLLGPGRPFTLPADEHGPRDGGAWWPWMRGVLERSGLASHCDGEVLLLTQPRLLGRGFNPVSFWLCLDGGGELRAVLAEVNNTFGQHHSYLLAHDDARAIRPGDTLSAAKCFHVSPFLPVRGAYEFRFHLEPDRWQIGIDLLDGDTCPLRTGLDLELSPLTDRALLRWLTRWPLDTVAVWWRIHRQALSLWRQRAPYHPLPPCPTQEISR